MGIWMHSVTVTGLEIQKQGLVLQGSLSTWWAYLFLGDPKAHRGDTLSSSKAECVAISDAVKEIKFMYYLLQAIRYDVELLAVVKTDNIGEHLGYKMPWQAYTLGLLILNIMLFERMWKMESSESYLYYPVTVILTEIYKQLNVSG